MTSDRSRDALLKFLDWTAEKGLVPANTASARKAAANKMLGLLSAEEAVDVTVVDVDDVAQRFGIKFGQKYNPDSLLTYKSRLRSAIDDFSAYCDNPVGFRPAGRSQQRSRQPKDSSSLRQRNGSDDSGPRIARPTSVNQVVPIALRADLTVQIGNLPFDLTESEARRIANVILAYAVPSAGADV